MTQLKEEEETCPYCGEPITLLIDTSVPSQLYIEDCEVCCRPIVVSVHVQTEDLILLNLRQEDD